MSRFQIKNITTGKVIAVIRADGYDQLIYDKSFFRFFKDKNVNNSSATNQNGVTVALIPIENIMILNLDTQNEF